MFILITILFVYYYFPENRTKSVRGHIRRNNNGSDVNFARLAAGRQHSGELWKRWRHQHQVILHCYHFRFWISRVELAGLRLYHAQNGHVPMDENVAQQQRRTIDKCHRFEWRSSHKQL